MGILWEFGIPTEILWEWDGNENSLSTATLVGFLIGVTPEFAKVVGYLIYYNVIFFD